MLFPSWVLVGLTRPLFWDVYENQPSIGAGCLRAAEPGRRERLAARPVGLPMATLSDLPIPLDLEPMEAKLVDDLPAGSGWRYEPKWDGFRCLAFRAGDRVELKAKSGKSLARFFPDMVEAL